MGEIRITNCHVHTFTAQHTPRDFPNAAIAAAARVPGLVAGLRKAASVLPWERAYLRLARLEAFHRSGNRESQADVLDELIRSYPRSARFVVLPMDMAPAGHGPTGSSLREQHDALAALARDPVRGPQVIPFATIHPDRGAEGVREFRRCVEEHRFRGLKLYPKLGYWPTHPLLMREVYPLCQERGLPVVTHCSRGGIWRKHWSREWLDAVSAPDAWEPVLDAFPRLRVCLAHFGGWDDWNAYLSDEFDLGDPEAARGNWLARILQMIRDEGRGNLWTDISYTVFRFEAFAPLLRLLLRDERVRRRVLFGSDFYMTRQEDLSEKGMSIRLRVALGEGLFRRIAEINPEVWLGERADGEGPESAMDPAEALS